MNNRFARLGIILVAVVIGSAGIWYHESSAELTTSEVITIIENYFRSSEGQSLIEKEVLSDNMDFEEIQKAIQLLDTQHEVKFKSVEAGFITVQADIRALELEVALLKAGIVSTGSSGGTSDFDLDICQDYRCDNTSNRFNQGDVLHLVGQHNTNDKTFDWDIYDEDDIRVDSGRPSLTSGNFIWAWTIPSDLEDGTYRLVIEIDNEKDTINFIVD